MKTLFLLRGLPGAGKTSAAKALSGNMDNSSIHAADDYFYENGPNPSKYDFDGSKLGIAHKTCVSRVKKDMEDGVEKIFVTNTFTKEKDMKVYMKMAEEHGYITISMIIENRHGHESVHGVPTETLDRFEKELMNNIKLK